MSGSQGQLADDVVSLAGRYRSQEELSIYEMLKRSGYPERRGALTVEAIRKALARSPEHMSEWLDYSADKRSNAGWYLRSANGQFEIGSRRSDGSVAEQRRYSDLEEACGYFIFHELDQIAFE
jgi:hypothetical protein